jgi:hypothetical protein
MRYTISQFDGDTWQVIEDGHELCVVGNYEGHEDAADRAGKICAAMELAFGDPQATRPSLPSYERRPFNPQPKPEKGKKR